MILHGLNDASINQLVKDVFEPTIGTFYEVTLPIEKTLLHENLINIDFCNLFQFFIANDRIGVYFQTLACKLSRTLDEILTFQPFPCIRFKCHGLTSSEPAALFQPDLLVWIIRLVRIQIFSLAIFNHFLHDEAD